MLWAQTFLMQFTWMVPSLLFGIYLGLSTGAWHMLAMSAITTLIWAAVRKFSEGRVVDLNEPVIINGPEVWIGDYLLPRREILWKREWHQLVFTAWQAKHSAPVFDLDLQLETDGVHAVIIGPTGSGKSELLKLVLARAVSSQPESQVTLIDFKGGATFGKLSKLSQVKRLVTDIDGHNPDELWNEIRSEVGRRELALAAKGASRIEDPIMFSTPRHYIFIDELAAVLAESQLAIAALTMVATRGRSLGIHLIAATQTAQGIPRSMLTNLRVRIALAESDPIDLAQLNIKRPLEPASVLAGWSHGIVQRPGSLTSHFNFPLGASFGF
jgi:type II secretory pathway predicted ATPase ExeA